MSVSPSDADKCILFLGHEATRTGAPNSLLRIVRWIKSNTKYFPAILLLRGGPQLSEYENIAPSWVLYRHCAWSVGGWAIPVDHHSAMISSLLQRGWEIVLRKKLVKLNPHLIYTNTLAAADALRFVPFKNVPVVTHVRELETAIRNPRLVGIDAFRDLQTRTKRFLAVSDAVKTKPDCAARHCSTRY